MANQPFFSHYGGVSIEGIIIDSPSDRSCCSDAAETRMPPLLIDKEPCGVPSYWPLRTPSSWTFVWSQIPEVWGDRGGNGTSLRSRSPQSRTSCKSKSLPPLSQRFWLCLDVLPSPHLYPGTRSPESHPPHLVLPPPNLVIRRPS